MGQIGDFNPDKLSQLNGNICIAHTRWATHGGVTINNCHPHLSNNKKIAVVHNGIIENYQELKKDLIKLGYKFLSETDTEVIPNLIEEKMKAGMKPEEATRRALLELKGNYATLVNFEEEENLIGAR